MPKNFESSESYDKYYSQEYEYVKTKVKGLKKRQYQFFGIFFIICGSFAFFVNSFLIVSIFYVLMALAFYKMIVYKYEGIKPLSAVNDVWALRLGEDEFSFPVSFTNDELTRHMLINGTTGSGKTSQIMSMIGRQLERGGGVIYIDGKSENPTWIQFYQMAKKYNRQDEIFLLSFRASAEAMSSRWNFLMEGSSSRIADIIINLSIGSAAQSAGDNKVFIDRAKNLVKIVCSALTYLRDIKGEVITINDLSAAMSLNALSAMTAPTPDEVPDNSRLYSKYWIPNDYIEKGMTVPAKDSIREYLRSIGANEIDEETPFDLDDYDSEIKENLVRQHSFAHMQLQEVLNDLGNIYGRIFNSKYSDISLEDIIANNLLLYVLVPSLEKEADSKAQIGKMVLTAIRSACAYMLGARSEGTGKALEKDLFTKRARPVYLIIMDEYGSYVTPGAEDIFAQARSLGISLCVSIQEYGSLEIKGDLREKKRVKSNTNIKVVLKTECPETIEEVVKAAGKRKIWVEGSKSISKTSIFRSKTQEDLQEKEVDRVSPDDLKQIKDGYGYILYNGIVRKFRADYVKPEKIDEVVLPKMIPRQLIQEYSYETYNFV